MKLNYTEVVKFLIVGGFTFCIDYGLLYCFTEYLEIQYLTSSGLSFSISVIANYFLCLKFVFRDAKNGSKQVLLFVLGSIGGLILNQISMSFFVEVLDLYYMVAKIIATGLVTVWNFITKKMALIT